MSDMGKQRINCQCACGEFKFVLKGEPLIRAYCHCTICQEFNNADFADISVFKRSELELPEDESAAFDKVAFKSYQSPAVLNRGTCQSCGQPAIELLAMPLFPELVILPNQNTDKAQLPSSSIHIFYGRRQKDIQDKLPKKYNYLSSQLSLMAKLSLALIKS